MGVQTMSSHGDDGRRGLPRQGSVYSLTLTEVETQLGEPLRSMNLDELLRTVLPAAAGPSSSAAKKTVDEVWRDIQSAGGGARQPTMGEMTLEDFLSRAGVAVDAGPRWLNHQYYPPQQHQYVVPRPLPLVGAGDGVGLFLSQVAGRKRGAAVAGEGVAEWTVERRQKRMIKNRESAARSRARKQVPGSAPLRSLHILAHFSPSLSSKLNRRDGFACECRRTPTSSRTRSPYLSRRTSASGSSR
jgi:ABA responsive element binding factor